MYNRAEVVDQNFSRLTLERHLPQGRSTTDPVEAGLSPEEVAELFESQVISRHLDLRARILKNENRCYYTIGSSGHEGNAALGKAFRYTDMAFLHYRSGAFMVQRSRQLPGTTPIYDLLLSFTASTEDPIAGGRHKVFGSKPLFVPPQTSTIASHLPKAVGAALSISRAKDLRLPSELPSDSVIMCSFGDASTNHSTAVGAINTASLVAYQNMPMPIVFVCEDNRVGISVPTPDHWIEDTYSNRKSLYYIQCDGLNICDVYAKAKRAVHFARRRRQPVFLHMKTIRLLGHAGSDMESNYHPMRHIEETEFNDPLLHTARVLLESGSFSPQQLVDIYEEIREQVRTVSESACRRPRLADPNEVASTITACEGHKQAPSAPTSEELHFALEKEANKLKHPLHMAKLINVALHETLLQYKNTLVFGEDVAKKGGVYNVTDGLYKRFGPRRVFNSPLDEQSIIGSAIGLAHNGFLPIPEIQFLAYVHNAEDQIRGEAATLAFFSKGQYTNPMVLRVAGLAYQKGFGGHFHNDNSLAVFRDIPGLIIACPSNGADAVRMLRTCVKEAYESGRVVIFIEPIALYMTRDLHQEGDKEWSFLYPPTEETAPLGQSHCFGEGRDLAIVSYGNGYYYSRQAAKVLQDQYGIKTRVIDLRWIAPLDKQGLCENLKDVENVLIVDECRKTGSLGEALFCYLHEGMENVPRLKLVAAQDSFIPLGQAAAAGLPKKDEILNAAIELLGLKRS